MPAQPLGSIAALLLLSICQPPHRLKMRPVFKVRLPCTQIRAAEGGRLSGSLRESNYLAEPTAIQIVGPPVHQLDALV